MPSWRALPTLRASDAGIEVVVAGIGVQPLRTLLRAGWHRRGERLTLLRSFERGFELARRSASPPETPAGGDRAAPPGEPRAHRS
ncbi:MAG TPA: hypothetical protein VMT85_04150 [Thermoanaerobaculia bacterium]|nr:hypothetical protein [Thermoanaerobaculia bacterium]